MQAPVAVETLAERLQLDRLALCSIFEVVCGKTGIEIPVPKPLKLKKLIASTINKWARLTLGTAQVKHGVIRVLNEGNSVTSLVALERPCARLERPGPRLAVTKEALHIDGAFCVPLNTVAELLIYLNWKHLFVEDQRMPTIHSITVGENNTTILMEYIPTSVADVSRDTLPWSLRLGMYVDLWGVLEKLHGLNIAHRDVKLDNIRVRANGTLVLSDYDSAVVIDAMYGYRPGAGETTAAAPTPCHGRVNQDKKQEEEEEEKDEDKLEPVEWQWRPPKRMTRTQPITTVTVRPPELLGLGRGRKPYDPFKVDVYSAALTCIAISNGGQNVITHTTPTAVLEQYHALFGDGHRIDPEMFPGRVRRGTPITVLKVFCDCLVSKPASRPTARDVLAALRSS